ncbi:hypothetical protein NVP1115B_67 [Vibrio phage 1.115.B._10N.222.49.B11]|nr:hypothetical protein NVP1115A_67 [Vibrio phage 1.115.A._10N.222.49.B11]AUR88613.1 hypothetical protein NVP1115B_67 [Vibrio phage 1.115.B._10N.222.49.B11]
MKRKLKITGAKITIDRFGHEYFEYFECKSDSGERFNIDALVSGEFDGDTEELNQDELIEWAKSKVGRYLFVSDISPCVYVACGKTYII